MRVRITPAVLEAVGTELRAASGPLALEGKAAWHSESGKVSPALRERELSGNAVFINSR